MKAEKIWFDNDSIHLRLDDGREGALPLKAFPRLYNATEQQRESYTLSPMGISVMKVFSGQGWRKR